MNICCAQLGTMLNDFVDVIGDMKANWDLTLFQPTLYKFVAVKGKNITTVNA